VGFNLSCFAIVNMEVSVKATSVILFTKKPSQDDIWTELRDVTLHYFNNYIIGSINQNLRHWSIIHDSPNSGVSCETTDVVLSWKI
jgi:hypothetical protein